MEMKSNIFRSTIPLGPASVRLAASTICQLKCPGCRNTQGVTQEKIGSGFLSAANFRIFVDQNPQVVHIELSGFGEMFLNPDLLEIIAYAYSRDVVLTAVNGVNLNTVDEQVLEGMVKYKFFALSCSMDGACQETYGAYRQGGNFERVIENIKLINIYKKKYQSFFPLLMWQFIVFGHNEQDIPAARKMAKDLGMYFFIKRNERVNYSPVKDKEGISREMNKCAISREFYRNNKKGFGRVCGQIWNNLQINWDGRVLGCCKNQSGDFGNAFNQGFSTVFYGEGLEYARRMLMGKASPETTIPCAMCERYKLIKETNDWMAHHDVWYFKMALQHVACRIIHKLGWKRLETALRIINLWKGNPASNHPL
jgi:MoaA/NifB/PqqE/SkfB family radical SAM enzyme